MSTFRKLINSSKTFTDYKKTNFFPFLCSRTVSKALITEKDSNPQITKIDDEITSNEVKINSVLEEPEQLPDLSHFGPEFRPSFNFAYYANKSEVIKELVNLGVDFHKIEQREKKPSYLLGLDVESDVKPYVSFLHNHGVPSDQLGYFFTKNPFLFKESLDDLEVRINYLQSKRFTPEMISRIITNCPQWLNLTTNRVDTVLGFIQNGVRLSGKEIRYLICRCPKLILNSKNHFANHLFLFKDIIQFDQEQTKALLLKQPYAWRLPRDMIHKRLDIMLVDMQLPLSAIAHDPCGLVTRETKMKERYLYLKELGKAQFDSTKPGYISIADICHGNDTTFCEKVAKTSVETYNLFLKTL